MGRSFGRCSPAIEQSVKFALANLFKTLANALKKGFLDLRKRQILKP